MNRAHAALAAHDEAENAAERMVLGMRIRSVEITCGRISYVDEGTGPTILLLHGAPVTSLGFVRVIRALAPRFRVIAPDLPGFGGSTASSGFRGTLDEYAGFVEQLCRALELRRVYAYVNDASGSFGLRAMARLSASVSGVVVADTVPIPLTGRAWLVKMILRYVVTSWVVRLLNRRWNLFPWLVASVAPLRPFLESERAVLVAQFDTPAKRDRVIDLFAQMANDDAFMVETETRVRERLAATPALILCGQFDPVRFVGGVARFRRLLPQHAVRIISREQHFPILGSGERVAAVIDEWIANVEAGASVAP